MVLKLMGGSKTFMVQRIIFLKLGGSLITEKARPATSRIEVLGRLAKEIAAAVHDQPGLGLVLGHGSGSYGHVPAQVYGTRQGVFTPVEWLGFAEVWRQANALNRLVMDALLDKGLPVMSFAPSAMVLARSGQILRWEPSNLQRTVEKGLIPVVYGDVVFDQMLGGTILSTEDLFDYLAPIFKPQRILLAGIEPGVWGDFPACTHILPEINSSNIGTLQPNLAGSVATDVTGGMASKVHQSLGLCQRITGLQVSIFSGEKPGVLEAALRGAYPGSRIQA
jgi:isopentenyl phosphate kinase